MEDPVGLPLRWAITPDADVTLLVRPGGVPEIPAADLADHVVARRDDDGTVIDWDLVTDGDEGSGGLGHVRSFWAWRRAWERRLPIGTSREIAALRAVAAQVTHGDDLGLDGLLSDLATADDSVRFVTTEQLDMVAPVLDDVRFAASVSGESGAGVFVTVPARRRDRPARTWSRPTEPYLLAASPAMTLGVHPRDGLVAEVHSDTSDHLIRLPEVAAVDLATEPVRIEQRSGAVTHHPPASCRPLAWLAPGALGWVVRTLPLDEVWASCFDAIATLARGAADDVVAGRIGVTTRVPLG